jgi:tetratricopeptide (TPR) repeat protein
VAQTSQHSEPLDGAALLSSLAGEAGSAGEHDLWREVEQAAKELDPRRAELVCEALLSHLAEQPEAMRELRALVVLGLAHPKALAGRQSFLVQEGRRLAGLLESRGESSEAQVLLEMLSRLHPEDRKLDHELASLMQRSGNADRLVERYMHRAEEALAAGQRAQAIQCLREVLAVDRNRRDAARMIRDLQYEASAKRRTLRRRVRMFSLFVLMCGAVAFAVWREIGINELYDSLSPASVDNIESLRARLDGIDAIVEGNPLWVGAFRASQERSQLRARITQLESLEIRERIQRDAELGRKLDEAESHRIRYRVAVEEGKLDAAVEHLRAALEVAPADWEHRARLESDLAALQGPAGAAGRKGNGQE